MSFNLKHIPVIFFFFTGLHADYHRPSDTSDKINAAGAIKVLKLVYMTWSECRQILTTSIHGS